MENIVPCKLCGSSAPLQRSHILPEFVYRPTYDAKHKAYGIDPLAPNVGRVRKLQKGFRELMLCRDCEQFLNDAYEKPFKELWFDRGILEPLETEASALLQCGSYERLKLFHLSVLLRADLATCSQFQEVALAERHRARLLKMVRNQDAGEPHEYPIVCSAISRPDGSIWWDLVGSPNPGHLCGSPFYEIAFAGCSWMYFIGSPRNKLVEALSLRRDGALPVAKGPWAAVNRFAPYAKLRR